MASVSPAEGARGTSPRSAGGAPLELPPPPPRADGYLPYWPCVLCFKYQRGKVVSKKASVTGQRAYKNIQAWTQVVKTARKLNKVAPLGEEDILPEAPPGRLRGGARISPRSVG